MPHIAVKRYFFIRVLYDFGFIHTVLDRTSSSLQVDEVRNNRNIVYTSIGIGKPTPTLY